MRYFVYLAFLTGFICFVTLHNAESKASVQVEPYSEDSLQMIKQSMEKHKDNFKKLVKLFARIQKAIDDCNTNPAGKDTTNLMHSMLLFSCLEFTKSVNNTFDEIIPELEKYKAYLLKVSAQLRKEPVFVNYKLEADVEALNATLNELRSLKESLAKIQHELFALIALLLKDHQGTLLNPQEAYVLLCK